MPDSHLFQTGEYGGNYIRSFFRIVDGQPTHEQYVIPLANPSSDPLDNLKVNTYTWNSNNLAWEASTGGGGEVTGAVEVTNFPATQPVSGAVSVSNLPETQPISGTVGVSNFPATQPISAAELPLPTGVATSAYQVTLESLIETLQELTSRLAILASWENAGATGMRVVGVSMPSTAVTGPITSAQYIAATPLRQAMENLVPILSNVNNVTGA